MYVSVLVGCSSSICGIGDGRRTFPYRSGKHCLEDAFSRVFPSVRTETRPFPSAGCPSSTGLTAFLLQGVSAMSKGSVIDELLQLTDPLEDFLRVPGLLRNWEVGQVLDDDHEFHVEGAGTTSDGAQLYAVYRRQLSSTPRCGCTP